MIDLKRLYCSTADIDLRMSFPTHRFMDRRTLWTGCRHQRPIQAKDSVNISYFSNADKVRPCVPGVKILLQWKYFRTIHPMIIFFRRKPIDNGLYGAHSFRVIYIEIAFSELSLKFFFTVKWDINASFTLYENECA